MDDTREIEDDGAAPNVARAYDKEVRRLIAATDPLDAGVVFRCLLLRDTIARRYARDELDTADVTTVLAADGALSGLAVRLARVPDLDAFRQRFTPSAEAWWWHLRPLPWAARHETLWRTLTLLCLAFTLSFVADLGRRFHVDGVDLLGAVVIALPTLLSVLTVGSVLSESLHELLDDVYGWLRIPTLWRGLARAICATLVFFLVAVGWWERPRIARFYNDDGLEALKEGRLADAEAALQRAVRLDPSYARAHYNLGSIYEEMQQNDRAETSYMVAFGAGDVSAANNLGRLLLLDQKVDEAAQVLQRAEAKIGEAPERIRIDIRYHVLKNLGWVRLEQNRYDAAEGYLERAIDVRKDGTVAKCLLVKVRHARGEGTTLTDGWDACLRGDPGRIEEDRWRREASSHLQQ